MAKVSANRNNLLAVRLLQVRRHLVSCTACHGAIKSRSFDLLCDSTKEQLMEVAVKWDANIPGRLTGARSSDGLQFLCPDPNAHGAAYAAVAEAVTVTAIQDSLF